jgi:hypothetical protein
MSEDRPALVASGGWCAPSALLYGQTDRGWFQRIADDLAAEATDFPRVSVARGGVDFTDRRTSLERAADEAHAALVGRVAERLASQRREAIAAACVTALANGWDVHVYDPPQPELYRRVATDQELFYLRSVGIEFRPAEHPVPTLVRHVCPDWWDDDD